MMELEQSEVDLEKYVEEAQPYIARAMQAPSSLKTGELKEVASVIVARAWEDQGYYAVAAKLCKHIALKEWEEQDQVAIPRLTFHNSVIETCQLLFRDHVEMRKTNIKYWLSFVSFIFEAYVQMRQRGQTVNGLSIILYGMLNVLVQSPSLENEEEVQLLSVILQKCGYDLELDDDRKMTDLYAILRAAFLRDNVKDNILTTVLSLLEMYAASWELSRPAKLYYNLDN